MGDWLQGIFLALLQGLTEFLPISSSAHLVIPARVLGWPDQGLAFDVAVHVGTLAAVVGFYRRDLVAMAGGCLEALRGRRSNSHSHLVLCLGLATVPAGIVGLLADAAVEAHLRNLRVIATATLLFGLLLGVADRVARPTRDARALTMGIALLVGLAQVLALVPGVSRSGVTITAALLLGLDKPAAARFSFLLSIPLIACAGGLKGLQLAQAPPVQGIALVLVATLVAGVTAYLSIGWFLRLLTRVGLMPFVWYRVVLALVLYTIVVVNAAAE